MADGFHPEDPDRVAAAADVMMMLTPDEGLPALAADLGPRVRAGGAVGFAHGAALEFGGITFPPEIDVVLVAPAGPGVDVRERFEAGAGVPGVVAVQQDATGTARDRALAYAKAIGCTRAGVYLTSVREEAVVDIFGEQVALCGGLAELVGRAYDTLVSAGYSREMAYLECVHQIQLTAGLITRFGVDGMWDAVSRTARYGGLMTGPRVVGGPSEAEMRRTLEWIESGRFFDAFLEDHETGGHDLRARRQAAVRDDLEEVGRTVRSWFDKPQN